MIRQPPGTYTARGHSLRVAPLFVVPAAAWLAHALAGTGLRALARRDAARLSRLQGALRKMVASLKARLRSTNTLVHIRSLTWLSAHRGSQLPLMLGQQQRASAP